MNTFAPMSSPAGYGAPIPLTPVIFPQPEGLLAEGAGGGGPLGGGGGGGLILEKIFALPLLILIPLLCIPLIGGFLLLGGGGGGGGGGLKGLLNKWFGRTPIPTTTTTSFYEEYTTPGYDYYNSTSYAGAAQDQYQRQRRQADSGLPILSLPQVEKLTQVVFAALKSQECIQRLLCEAGSMSRSFSNTAHSVAQAVEQFVPESMKDTYDVFAKAEKCEQYACGTLKVKK